MELLALPEETWILIFSFCNPEEDLLSIKLTCPLFNRLCDENVLWKIFYHNKFGDHVSFRKQLYINEVPNWKEEFKWRKNPAIRVQLFNNNTEDCIESMKRENIFKDSNSFISFLRFTGGLSHKVVYSLIQKPNSYGLDKNIFIDEIKKLDFSGLTVLESLRLFSKIFGNLFHQQGQEMSITALSEGYFSSSGTEVYLFSSSEQVYCFLYVLLMLNTDAHHPQVTKKMKLHEFIKNIKAIGCEVPDEILSFVYKDITENEIICSIYPKITGEICYSNWMKIKDNTGTKKRWVVLTTNCLVIYRKKCSLLTIDDNCLMVIELFYSSSVYTPENMPNLSREQLVLYTDQAFYLIPSSKQEFNEWFENLTKVIQQLKNESNEASILIKNDHPDLFNEEQQ